MRLLSELLNYLKIKELYPPQKEAINYVEKNHSVLVSVPTAAGKTLVAYAALMRAVKAKKKGIYLVPLRALAWEKVEELKNICKHILKGAKVADIMAILGSIDVIMGSVDR